MTEIYDMYGDETLEALGTQLGALADNPLYEPVFEEAGLRPAAIDGWDEFRRLPFTTTADLIEDAETNEPEGSLYREGSMISFTPAKDRELPVYETPADLQRYAEIHEELFRRLGIESGDRAMIILSYHGFGTGYLLHRALEHNGVEVIPAGPGDAKAKAKRIDNWDVDLLWGNPSFALEIAEHGGESLSYFIGGGEPFTSIPSRREAVHEAFGDLDWAIDYFGLRQAWPVAVECADENGLHVVDDYMLVEVIDPETGETLPLGERGEVVLTHLDREASPMVRYRTGDLSMVIEGTCSHADRSVLTMPQGVFGRTDEMHKIKGVKVYTEGLTLVLAGFPDLSMQSRIEISHPTNTDYLRVVCEGTADEQRLREELTRQLAVSPDEIELVDELEDPGVYDERY